MTRTQWKKVMENVVWSAYVYQDIFIRSKSDHTLLSTGSWIRVFQAFWNNELWACHAWYGLISSQISFTSKAENADTVMFFTFSYVVTANESDPGATAFFGCDKGKV
jgi:hypothetical protein